ncbi:unnamed protein product, partial [Hydatigera taeniaeformis]|uniref:SH2 domain-containing protein n=1 Tax=Hydatigena taeniaeformis TaxID=6205 RepID=A0A0R3XDD4_HYDTA
MQRFPPIPQQYTIMRLYAVSPMAFSDSTNDEVVTSSDDQEENELVEQPWFHGPLNPKIAFNRLLNSGSFLVTSDEHDQSLFYLFMKWNGRCFCIDIPFNPITKNYTLGSVARNNFVDLINFYITNQLPVRDDIGAILFSPVVVPRSDNMNESKVYSSLHGAAPKESRV